MSHMYKCCLKRCIYYIYNSCFVLPGPRLFIRGPPFDILGLAIGGAAGFLLLLVLFTALAKRRAVNIAVGVIQSSSKAFT